MGLGNPARYTHAPGAKAKGVVAVQPCHPDSPMCGNEAHLLAGIKPTATLLHQATPNVDKEA